MTAPPRALYLDCSPKMRALVDAGAIAAAPTPEFHDGDPAPRDLPGLLRGVRVALSGHTPMPAAVLEGCPDLAAIIFLGTGASSYIDLAAAERLGIAVHTIRDYGSRSVAEDALALALAGLRQVAAMDRDLRAGLWRPRRGAALAGRDLSVLGTGAIGREVIGLGDALAGGDVVSLHLALTAETTGLLGRRELALMKLEAVLVNTARGALTDEDDGPFRGQHHRRRPRAAGDRGRGAADGAADSRRALEAPRGRRYGVSAQRAAHMPTF